MYIKELKIKNFKGFSGEQPAIKFQIPDGQAGSGLNIFVGENNTGKSTVFEAIDFLRNNTRKSMDQIKTKNGKGEVEIELLFEGNVEAVIDGFSQPNKVAVFKRYVYGEDNQKIKFSRSTPEQKALKLWSEEENEFKNESGIDAPVKKLFEANFVWADTNPNEETNFGSTTICGNLLKEIAKGFTETADYQGFSEVFHRTFNADESGLRQALRAVEEKTQEIFREQFGEANITFKFNELKIDSFFKNTDIEIDDGISTSMEEKGSGMQRAVALAMLQVYAEELIRHPEEDISRPFFLFIDEPEICLHPKAQEKLLSALLTISRSRQVFVTTHSPFFISTPFLDKIGLYIFKSDGNAPTIEAISNTHKLLPWSPTWGEINFKAYDLPTIEFHNELYGRIQELSGQHRIDQFENWLVDKGLQQNMSWTKEVEGNPRPPVQLTLQSFIRNKVHHPENETMQAVNYSKDGLRQSIVQMIAILENNQATIVAEE